MNYVVRFIKKYESSNLYVVSTLIVCLVPLLFLNINSDHAWGDDFAQYLKQAENIANFKNFSTTNYIYNEQASGYAPPYYPPIYSLVLAPIVKLYGFNYEVLSYYNTFLLILLVISVFYFFRKQNISALYSFLLCLVFANNPVTLDMKISCLSEIVSSLFFFLYLNTRGQKKWFIVSALCAILAINTRTIFIIIIIYEVLYFLWVLYKRKKDLAKQQGVFIIYLILFYILIKLIFIPQTSISGYKEYLNVMDISSEITKQLEYYLIELKKMVSFKVPNTLTWSILILESFVIFWVLAIMIYRVFTIYKNFDMLMLMNFFVICTYKFPQGFRYLYPFLPIIIYYLYYGLIVMYNALQLRKIKRILQLSTLFILYFYHKNHILESLERNKIMGVKNEAVQKMFVTINARYASKDVFCFLKPRALALYTHVKTIHYPWSLTSDDQVKLNFKKHNVQHILLWIDQNDFMTDYVKRNIYDFKSPDTIEGYVLYSCK